MKERINIVRNAVAPEGKRPPFMEQLSQKEALNWWRLHRYDAVGAKALQNMTQKSILELDLALVGQGPLDTEGDSQEGDSQEGNQSWLANK